MIAFCNEKENFKIWIFGYQNNCFTAGTNIFMDFKFSQGFLDYLNKVEYAAIELHLVQIFLKKWRNIRERYNSI